MEPKQPVVVIKKLTLVRETLRVLVRTGLRAGSGIAGDRSVREGTLSATGMGKIAR